MRGGYWQRLRIGAFNEHSAYETPRGEGTKMILDKKQMTPMDLIGGPPMTPQQLRFSILQLAIQGRLVEQKRIVAKLEEILPLCERLGAKNRATL